ncbi:hypothetical protein YPPY100_4699, partial [Yersinia pestis PY-100]|jgi:hypothetical protein
MAGAE